MELVNKVSGPAAKGAKSLSKLERALNDVRKEAERQKRLEAAVSNQINGKTKAIEKQTRAVRALSVQQRVAARPARQQPNAGRTSLANGLDDASTAAGGIALAGVGLAGAGALKLGMMIQDAQQFKSDTMFALTTILKSKDAAKAAYAMATKTAMDTGADFRTSMSGFNTLLAQGFDVKFADQLVRAMADLQTINPQANMEGITRAISQIKSTGRLQGDELMQLAEAGLSVDAVYKEIAKSMGVVAKDGKTAGQVVQDLQAAGKIDSKTAIDAIMASLKNQVGGKEFGETARARADASMKGAAMRALTMKEAFLSSIDIDWSPISRALTKVTEVLQSPAGEKFAASLGKAFTKVIGLLDNVTAKDIEGFFEGAGSAALSLSTAVSEVAVIFGELSSAYAQADAAFQSVAGISMFQALLDGLVGTLRVTQATLMMIPEGIAMLVESVLASVSPIGAGMIDGIVAGIEAGASAVADALVGAVDGAIEAAKGKLGIASPSKVTREMFQYVMDGAVMGANDGMPALTAASERMAAAPLEAGRTLRQSITNNTTNTSASSTRGNHFAPGAIQINAIDPAQALEAALRQAVIAA